ncbi:MAG: glycosyltransferase family 2 protein [Stigonema ocellatum SAG 48.90 = DSM 106950]|nr:glycosyltransferase family 2 protein [Stigonema ocellatum SAG 48.90 = DSM 106950]
MQKLAISLSIVLLGWLVIQVSISLLFLLYLRSPSKKSLPNDYLPKTAVVLFLGGASPLLSNCLRSLLNQNYPQYDLKLIIDSEEDSAWYIVAHTLSEEAATNVQVSPLRMPHSHCSLKCSALVQAVLELDDSYKVVALVDADAIVHSNWLRELVSPLAHPKVGATTGYPWYVPTGRYWGSSVRYMWNIFSVVKMYMYRIPWGGTLALKTELIYTTGLLDKWKRAYNEDTMIRGVLAKHGILIIFVPSLIILNREECDLSSFVDWSKQQLLSYRLYHPQWWTVVTDSILTVLLPYLMLVLCLAALWTRQWDAAAIFLNSLGVYTQILLFLVVSLEKGVQQILRKHHQNLPKISPATMMKLSIASPVTLWIYGLGMLSALFMTKIKPRKLL